MSALFPILTTAIRRLGATAMVDDRKTYSSLQTVGGGFFVAEQIDAVTSRKHIGLMFPTSGAFAVALIGAWLARKVAVPLNFLLAREELHYVIEDSEIDTIITVRALIDHLGDDLIPEGINVVYLDDMDFEGLPPLRWPPYEGKDELAALIYTSGTSGKPKGVMLTHGNLRENAYQSIQHAKLTRADTFFGVLPQFHSFGFTVMTLIPLYLGAKVVYTARFIPRKILSLAKEHRPDVFVAIPSMYGALLSAKDVDGDEFDGIRFIISGGEPLPDSVYENFRERFGQKILEGYGLTETAPVACWSTHEAHKRNAVGKPLPRVTIRTINEENQLQKADESGEILIAGPNVMKGYYKLPEQTADVFMTIDVPGRGTTRFFRTGDIGHVDRDGFVFITGRKKEMLIIGGENVFPREIEEVLIQHASVHASAVIGKRDDVRGEVPVAFVEIEEGSEFDETALRQWCRDRLAGYKVPREIRKIDELPRSPTGKILRRELSAD